MSPRFSIALIALLAPTACSNGSPRDAGAFCDRLRTDQQLVVSGVLTPADVSVALKSFRELGRLAPAAIEDEWDQLTLLVEQASNTGDDPAQRASLARQAAAALPAAQTVAEWARNVCGVDLPFASTPTLPTSSTPPTTKKP